MQFFTPGNSKMEVFETYFFDTVIIYNDHPKYVKHILGFIYVFFRCCVVRLPEATLFLLSPTSAVPYAPTVRTATSCSRSPRCALRLLADAECRVAGPAPSGPGRQTAFAHPIACPCGSPLVLRGDQFLGAVGHIFISFGALFTGVPPTCAARCARAAIRCASDERRRSAHCCPDCGGAAAARRGEGTELRDRPFPPSPSTSVHSLMDSKSGIPSFTCFSGFLL